MYLLHVEGEVLTVVVTIDHHFGVRSHERRFLLELLFEKMNRFLHRFVEQPVDQTERKHIPAFEHGFVVHTGVFECLFGQRGKGYRHNLHALRDSQFLKGILRVILRFLKVFVGQRIRIYN